MIVTIRLTPCWAARCLSAAEDFVQTLRRWPRFAHLPAAAAGLVLCASTTADLPAALLKPLPKPKPDVRIARLESFFQLYNCPQPRHISEYLRAADGYGLDYRLLPAISIRETQCGVAATENNRWGYHPGRQSFPSIQEGIDFVARELSQGFYYKGKNLRDKLFTYNPRAAYPDEVQWIMRQIE